MENAALTQAPEQLLGQADFVRALARSLLADPSTAEDVAQEALVAGLERPPASPGALRGWLARVVHRLVLQRRRGEARRAGREASAARAEGIPSTAQVLERESVRTAVVRAVLALEEPYRSAILLRFYEGRAPREIALQLGVPVETVHTRTKRALALLRARLDREFGERSAWAALLVPFTRAPVGPTGERAPVSNSSPNPTKPVMHPTLKLAGLGLVLLAGAVVWLRSGSARASATSGSVATAAPNASVDSRAARPTPLADPQRSAVRPSAAVAPDSSASQPTPPPTLALSTASLHLTLTWSDGSPAADVVVRATDVGRKSYDALEARTDAAGSCTFTGLCAGKVWVQIDRKEFPDSAQVAAGEETELAFQIPRGFDVEGHVVDASGEPVAGAAVWLGQLAGGPEQNFAVAISGADGSYAVRSCPDLAYLWARADGHAPSLGRTHEAAEGATVEETLRLRGAGATVTGHVLDPDGLPVEGALVLIDGQGMLRAERQTLPSGEQVIYSNPAPANVRTDADGAFALAGVRPGTVPLGVLATGYAPWRGSVAVAANGSAAQDVTLSAGWSLSGTVRDVEGKPVAGRIGVFQAAVSSQLCPTVLTGPDGSFEIQDLPPGSVSFWADGVDGDVRTTLEGQVGEQLTWDAYLGAETEEYWLEVQPWM